MFHPAGHGARLSHLVLVHPCRWRKPFPGRRCQAVPQLRRFEERREKGHLGTEEEGRQPVPADGARKGGVRFRVICTICTICTRCIRCASNFRHTRYIGSASNRGHLTTCYICYICVYYYSLQLQEVGQSIKLGPKHQTLQMLQI